MKIYSIYDRKFKKYGKVIEGINVTSLCEEMDKIAMPEEGVAYEASITSLEKDSSFAFFSKSVYGGMPVQTGLCWGHNTRLNCFEYHRDSELNIGSSDYILLLATMEDVENSRVDTSKAVAFKVPSGIVVEVYSTTLHYAPCQTSKEGFRVAIVLPRGTNTEFKSEQVTEEDKLLRARNKWLIAHADTLEAAQGAFVGLDGANIDLEDL